MIKKTIKSYYSILKNNTHIVRSQKSNGRLNAVVAEVIRNTHSIEKGLSISNPKLGFGHAKQKALMANIKLLKNHNSSYYKEVCKMGIDALREYLEYHRNHGYTDEFCDEIQTFISDYSADDQKYGGTILVSKNDFQFDIPQIERFFKTRHSIRDFTNVPVDDSIIKRAVNLAQTAPSACNRQAVGCYVLSERLTRDMARDLSGIGGFAENVDRFILITGKVSAYRMSEVNQYIVSASIFTAYLTMTLHLYGVGACVVQRPVTWDGKWKKMCNKYGISKDEQLVIAIAIGNMKDECVVPLSHRIIMSDEQLFIN